MRQLRKFNPKYFFIALLTVAIFCTLTCNTAAQGTPDTVFKRPLTTRDTVPPKKDTTNRVIIISSDTTQLPLDSLQPGDSVRLQRTDTFSLKLSKDTLDAPVKYEAQDSAVVLIQEKKIILYGKTKTEYKDITLTAPTVELDQQTQVLTAVNRRDSLGVVVEEANFRQGESSFYSDTIRYNFKTQKGLTKNTMSQQGEYVILGDLIKKVNDKVTYIKGARFTTCMYDDPHFDIKAGKMKMVSQKLAVSGAAHMEFEGVPIPIYLPFGIYPITQQRHGGLLPPQFATNDQMGIGLEGLGYYFVMNDYWDLKAYGSVYSYGSWNFNINPTYRRRYKYSGALNFGLQHTKMNFKGDPDYLSNNSYSLTWSHTSDTRARPGTSFSANVNASSTTYNKYVPNSPMLNFTTLMGSSITYSKTWQGKPYNLTLSANHSQNNISREVNVGLPDVGFSVATVYPFENKEGGEKKWYEQLGIGYNGTMRNQFSFYDSAFSFQHILDTLQWGAQHNIPISLSLPPIMGGAVVISPGLSYSQVWISRKVRLGWNDATKKIDTVVTRGFFVDQQAAMSLSFSTAVYGKYEFKKGRIIAIRHVMRPQVSMSYQPDLSSGHYYSAVLDSTGFSQRVSELQFPGSIYQGYSDGVFGGLSFQLDNNLEMKLRSKKPKTEDNPDSTKMTGRDENPRVKLIDGYGFSGSYNFLKDSQQLSHINLYLRTNFFDKINVTIGGDLNPYLTTTRGLDSNRYAWQGDKFSLGSITTANVSISTSFKSKPRDDKKEQLKQQQIQDLKNDPALMGDQQRLLDYMRQNPAEFVDFNIPWSFSLAYTLYYTRQPNPTYTGYIKRFTSSANFSGSFSLTPKWMFNVNGYYDFETNKIQMLQMAISRDMHCWQLSINVTPVGPYRYFNFSISPKSGLLQDLRINRTRSFYTGY